MKWYRIFLPVLFIASCTDTGLVKEYNGEAQGTTFSIKYYGEGNVEDGIDSILKLADDHFSTYLEHSMVSRLNASNDGISVDSLFTDLWEKCWDVNILSNGAFDPTLGPVLDLYKFGEHKDISVDSSEVSRALAETGMHLLGIRNGLASKKIPALKLDFNAIAQGYTVDLICDKLIEDGLSSFLVEIGGELRTRGKKEGKSPWMIGIDKPVNGQRKLMAKLPLVNQAMATSGNYRKFREVNGEVVGHILDPRTGFSKKTNILSVSVIHPKCYYADALATAFMNMKLEDIKDMDGDDRDLQVVVIYTLKGDTLTYSSPGLRVEEIKSR